ncbi:hypothetical protein [Fibrivirga algicola]|uniref:Uncharacterized protein n=1 Tax=Fibrivirga algicola TaxID=2950420 RepID=A0ABX0QF58_9BACT|nr:hypothetical protein [Fibrivirga algicola]ARK11020.1 hypothetical protein A6C57_12160 [Fibrella sp. ES10-3-2-2]NID09727.1 hypothetical protein [Fibrivirga algicola]
MPSYPTPFTLTYLAPGLYLHRIDLGTYASLWREQDFTFFFRDLTDQFARQGERIIHLWEDVERQKPAVVASRLAALQGQSIRIPGRLTQVRRIDKATATAFLDEHHLQPSLPGKIRYGLFLPERYYRILPPVGSFPADPSHTYLTNRPAGELLLAVATFAQPRSQIRDGLPHRSAELLRVASHVGTTVVGGLDKLLKTYLTNHPADDLMTYADRDWSDGASYRKLGFEQRGETAPQQFWLHPQEGIRHVPSRLPLPLNQTNVIELGYIPIYNTGSYKFVKISPHPRSLF